MATIKNSTAQIKKTNVELIKSIMKDNGALTCTELSRLSNLSIATCRNILNDLVDSNEILVGESNTESGGRPAKTYIFNTDYQLCMAIAFEKIDDSCMIIYSIFNLSGEILCEGSETFTNFVLDDVDGVIQKAISKYPTISSLSIAIPGISDNENSVIQNDIPTLNGVRFSDFLSKYNVRVKVSSTPDIIAYGYFKAHPELENAPFVALLVPKNDIMGAGIILNNTVYKGFYNAAGEIGYRYTDKQESLVETLTSNLTALVTILSPKAILVTGLGIKEEEFLEAKENAVPEFFTKPEITYEKNYLDYFKEGMLNLAIDNLSDKIRLVEF